MAWKSWIYEEIDRGIRDLSGNLIEIFSFFVIPIMAIDRYLPLLHEEVVLGTKDCDATTRTAITTIVRFILPSRLKFVCEVNLIVLHFLP